MIPGRAATTVTLNWTDNSNNENGFRVYQDGIKLVLGGSVSINYGWTEKAYSGNCFTALCGFRNNLLFDTTMFVHCSQP
jgi:hypothetical protein